MYNIRYKIVTDNNGQNVYKHVQEIFDVLAKWYAKLRDGTHVLAIPDPFNTDTNLEKAERLVSEIDQDFEEHENWRVLQHRYDTLPQFSRLSGNAKLAMVQEIIALLNYQKEHPEEYID